MYFENLPEIYKNESFYYEAIKMQGENIRYRPTYISENFFTEKVYKEAVFSNGSSLAYVPKNIWSFDLCKQALMTRPYAHSQELLGIIMAQVNTYIHLNKEEITELCLIAVKHAPSAIRSVPLENRTTDLYKLVKNRIKNCKQYFPKDVISIAEQEISTNAKLIGHSCDKKAISKEKIESAVINAVMKKIMDDKLMEQLSYRLYDLQMQSNSILPALREQLSDVEKGIDNMLDAIQQGIVLESTKKRLSDLENHKKQLEIEIAQEEIKNPLLTREQIEFGLTRFRKLDLSTQRGKQTLIDSFVNAIFLFDDYAIVTCNYKDGEEKITFEDIENSELGDYIKNKPEQKCSDLFAFGDPDENRTRVTAVKGRCLDRLTTGPSI